MRSSRRSLWLIIAVAAVGLSGAGLARGKVDCRERCKDSTSDCISLCQEHAGPKGRGFCKKACSDGEKKCEQKCAKKK